MKTEPDAAHASRGGTFPDTRWSVVLRAQGGAGREGDQALAELCQAYWYPVYAYVRRTGASPADAEDVTQGFFLMLLERDSLRTAAPERGRLRSFLLTALKHHMTSTWRREAAQKRGGGALVLSLDQVKAEERLASETAHYESPDTLYDQSWAYTMLAATMERLREYYDGLGKAALFAEMEPYLSGTDGEQPYKEVAARLGMPEGTLRFSVHKLRQRYQSLLRQQIADTVATAEEAEEEIAHLIRVLAGA